MSVAISLATGITAKITPLEVWMGRVLERAAELPPDWRADDVHDVRVALRRCRTMANVLRQVNPDPGWHKLKKSTKRLFHALGGLHDVQVERGWVKKRLGAPGDALRRHMLGVLGRRERKRRRAASDALDGFSAKAFRRLATKLAPKSRLFPLDSVVFQRVALESLNEAAALFGRARKGASGAAWHRARIAAKKFRYTAENFLPAHYEGFATQLKTMQDLLGDVHDLDVLRADIRRRGAKLEPAGVSPTTLSRWMERIAGERASKLTELRARMPDANSPWLVWRNSLRPGPSVAATTLSREIERETRAQAS